MGKKESRDYSQIRQVLMTLSMNEIPRCLDMVQIDVNNPPSDFSPLHYLVESTPRQRILLELMDLHNSSPFLSFQGVTLFRLACRLTREQIVERFIEKVRVNNCKQQAAVEREIDLYPNHTKRAKLRLLWLRRLRNSCRLFVLMLAARERGVRLSKNLVREVVLYM